MTRTSRFRAVMATTALLSTVCTAGGRAQVPTPGTDVVPGELLVEPPTLINLGFEWFIRGDDNRNAAVEVSYRRQGDSAWRSALPLLRLQGERIYRQDRVDVVSPNMFAGSILDLEPDTVYEARFEMTDPDGVRGQDTRTVTVRTRPEPRPSEGGRVFHVYPPGHDGPVIQPAFEGLMCAYNSWCAGTDWATSGRPRVRPGDSILVHAGVYRYNRYEYTNDPTVNRTVPLEGTYYLTADGTPERPISIRAAGDGEVVFDGDGNGVLFDVKAADYTYFEGITFRNTEVAISAGTQFIAGAKGLSVVRSRFEDVGAGIFTNYSGSSNFYIADNTFLGRNDPEHLIAWQGEFWREVAEAAGQQFPPAMASYVAVKLYGPGHVVAHNYIADFHDGINVETYGNPDGSMPTSDGLPDGPKYPTPEYWDRRPVAIDFYNNYITNSHDNPIETDGSMHNIRVMRNMFINHASHAFCNQPVLGGPAYWIRNIAYHIPGGSTRLTNGSAGVLFYHNTILAETEVAAASNVHWRNNLMLGENAAEAIFSVNTYTRYSSSDYNGFRPNPGVEYAFEWTSPATGVPSDFTDPEHEARLEARRYGSFQLYSRISGQDANSIQVDYDIFENVPQLDAKDLATVQRLYDAADLDFRLKPDAVAVDRGVALPTVNDDATGAAPDLGALEVGQEPPVYGPRP